VIDGVERRVRTAYSLAQRGALYSARVELIGGLRRIAEALDAEQGTNCHGRSLADALRALEEVEDFAPRGARRAAEIDVSHVVSGHRTPVLKQTDSALLTPLLASQRYYTFAQEQLAAAVQHVPAGSQALFGLGKLQGVLTGTGSDAQASATARAMVYYQAALLVDGRNYMAANEMGVLLARTGQWEDARKILQHGLLVHPRPELWRNLARVHQQLGEYDLAARATARASQAEWQLQHSRSASGLVDGGGFVRWVAPETFNRSVGGDMAVPQSAPPPVTQRPAKTGISAWLPWPTTKR
jgi:tetratricopeptide (TPR) repeat protein